MPSFGFTVIRAAFALAEHVAPRATARIAFELFCRTRGGRPRTPGEAAALERAAQLMTGARHHALKTRSGRIAVHDFAPTGGRRGARRILVVHGSHSRTEHLDRLIQSLLDAGNRVIAVDLPGHGASSGRRLTLVSAVEAVAEAALWFGPFDAIVGHSFGGAVAANAVMGTIDGIEPVQTGRLVMIASPNSMPALFDDFGRFLSLGTRTQTALADHVERIAGHPLETYVVADQLARTKLPVLVIHAPDDREVNSVSATAIAAAGDHVRLHLATGLGHRRIVADPAILDRVACFASGVERAKIV